MAKKRFVVNRKSGSEEVIAYARAVCEEAILAAYDVVIEISIPKDRSFNDHIPFSPAEAACWETGTD